MFKDYFFKYVSNANTNIANKIMIEIASNTVILLTSLTK